MRDLPSTPTRCGSVRALHQAADLLVTQLGQVNADDERADAEDGGDHIGKADRVPQPRHIGDRIDSQGQRSAGNTEHDDGRLADTLEGKRVFHTNSPTRTPENAGTLRHD